MTRGRPPKPNQVKELQGTLRNDRKVEEVQASLISEVPPAPKVLSKIGKKEWLVVCEWLLERKLLAATDLSLIAMYCNEMAKYWEFEHTLRKNGRIMGIKDDSGKVKYLQQLPEVSMQNLAFKNALMLAGQFGYTPAARMRIGTGKAAGTDPLAEFLEKYS